LDRNTLASVDSNDINQALRLLGQQVSYAHRHSQLSRDAKNLPAKRMALQASIMSLNLGLVAYLQKIFPEHDLATVSALTLMSECRGGILREVSRPSNCGGDELLKGAQEEIISLWQDLTSWLREFSAVAESLAQMPGQKSALGVNLIARGGQSIDRHWTELDVDTMTSYICAAENLLQGQINLGQEC